MIVENLVEEVVVRLGVATEDVGGRCVGLNEVPEQQLISLDHRYA